MSSDAASAMAMAMEMAPQALVIATADGRATHMNQRARALLALADARAVGNWPACLPRPAVDSGSGWRSLPLGDGGSAPFWIWSRPMPASGVATSASALVLHALWPCRVGADQDTGAQRDPAAFDEMMAAQARHALMGEMGGALAHQMSQPLNIIRLTAERAAMEAEAQVAGGPARAHASASAGDDGEGGRDDGARFARLADQAEILFETVSLLQGAPPVSGPEDLEVLDLGAIINRAAHLARGPMRAAGLRPDVVVPREPLSACGEPVLLLQVLFAVLTVLADTFGGQARADGGRGGTVQGLMIRLGQPTDPNAGGRLVVDMMPAGRVSADHTLTPVPPDLTLSRRLVLAALALAGIDGHLLILVDDQGGLRGVRLDLAGPPSAPNGGPRDPARTRSAAAQGTARVLLAEDEPEAATEIAAYLRDEGFAVDVAHDVAGALAALDTDPHDVLIADVTMPGGGARPILRAAEAAHPDMVLILVSGLDLKGSPAHADLIGMADAVLRKPLGLAQVRETIFTALGS